MSDRYAVQVREIQTGEHERWLELLQKLWPEIERDELVRGQREVLADPGRNAVFVAAGGDDGDLTGVVEVRLRDCAEGCMTTPVGYIEAWYVEPGHRRRGVGRRLVSAAEDWAREKGCTEMASDAEPDNVASIAAHEALGYREEVRLVAFAKKLRDAS